MFSKAIAILCYTILFIETFTSAQLIGIDTGSQFFKVALVKPGSPFQIVTNVHSKRKTETILGFEDAERRFGGDAVTLASRRPKQAISFVPRLLGRSIKHKTVESFSSQYLPFGIDLDDSRGTVNLTAIGGGNTAQKDISLSPEEAMAMILTHAKSNADRFSGGKVTDAVLTVPSYFTVSERDSMRDAAHIAGLKVLSLIEENTAAALQYGISRIFPNETHTVLIYNMGASSTQVSIFDFTTYVMKKGSKNQTFGQFQTVGKAWDEYLGGFAYDLKLVEFMADEFNKMKIRKGKKDVRQTPRAMAKIRKSAEKVKKVLSANKKYPITIESLCDDMDFRGTTITREQFETLASDLFERVLTPVEKALEMANKTIDQITQVEIVGGGVRIPKVQELLADFFKLDSVSALGVHLNGDEAMALGAAFRAANMSKAFRVGRAERSVGMIESSYFPIGLRLEELPEKIVEVSEEKEAGDGDAVGEAVSDAASADESIQKKKWSKRVSLFSRKSELLKKKKIKLTHDHDFSVTLKYDSHSKVNMDEAIDLVFREFNITGLEKFAKGDKKHLGTPQVELVFQLDSNGVPQISKAEAKLEEIVIVEEPKEEIKKEKEGEKEGINDTDVKDNQEEDKKKEEIKSEKKDEESEEEKKEEGGKEEKETEEKKDKEEKKVDEGKKDEEAKQEKEEGKKDGKEEGEIEEGEKKDGEKEQPKKKKTKKRIHRIQLNVVPVVSDAQSLHRMTIKQTNDASRRLRDMEAADELRQKRDAAKNSLESFVFELRGQVRDNEENLSKVSPDEEREKIMEDLEALEEWLYEDGEDGGSDAALSVYKEKRKGMKDRVTAIFTRLDELEKRPKAVKAARDVLKSSKEIMLLWPTERPQISEEETKEVEEVMESISTWLDEKEGEQKDKKDDETPAFTSREVSNKLSKLHNIVARLLKKKRPAPEKPKKDEATADNETKSEDGEEEEKEGEKTENESEKSEKESEKTEKESEKTEKESEKTEKDDEKESKTEADDDKKEEGKTKESDSTEL